MKQTTIRVARIVGGTLLIMVGVAGLFLPFLQGVLFIVAGLALLSRESEKARRLTEWLRSYWRRRVRISKGDALHGT